MVETKELIMSDIKKKDDAKIESRREFLKKISKWSKVALGTAVGITTIGSIACPPYSDYFESEGYCDYYGQNYYTYSSYCNYTNYGDY